MKTMLTWLLLPLVIFGCSKKPLAGNSPAAVAPTVRFVQSSEAKEMNDLRVQASGMLEKEDYEQLESLADKLRSSKDRYPNGVWKLFTVYAGLDFDVRDTNALFEARQKQLENWIEPCAGGWPTLAKLFDGMFMDGAIDQRPYFYGWVKTAMETFKSGSWRASQMLALAGDAGSGKSLTQNLLTEMFGGRSAKPYQYMRGGTEFNAHIFAGEHLVLEDESESVDPRSRKHFAAVMKTLLCGRDQNCHGKNREAIILRPVWRMTVSLNDDPERLLVLPPLDDDVKDKIIVLKVMKNTMPMPTTTPAQAELFWDTLVSELPAFLAHLEAWPIPGELADARYGVCSFHHPEIVERLNATNSEDRLLELVDLTIFHNKFEQRPWTGSAAELERKLTDDLCAYRNEAKRLLSWNAACGAFLGRLEKSGREFVAGRVSSRMTRGRTVWTINPPDRGEPELELAAAPDTRSTCQAPRHASWT